MVSLAATGDASPGAALLRLNTGFWSSALPAGRLARLGATPDFTSAKRANAQLGQVESAPAPHSRTMKRISFAHLVADESTGATRNPPVADVKVGP